MSKCLCGRDYLTTEEAATYCCVSVSQFRTRAREYGLFPFEWMGKLVYSRHQIQRAMEAAWRQSTGGGGRGTSTGPRAVASVGNRSGLSLVPKPNRRER